jgi:hypothetical protein
MDKFAALSGLALLAIFQLFGKGNAIAKGSSIAALCLVGVAVTFPKTRSDFAIALIIILVAISAYFEARNRFARNSHQ